MKNIDPSELVNKFKDLLSQDLSFDITCHSEGPFDIAVTSIIILTALSVINFLAPKF